MQQRLIDLICIEIYLKMVFSRISMGNLVNDIVELYKRVSYSLPEDIENALRNIKEEGTAKEVMDDIIKSIDLAKKNKTPICQDTGTPIFFIEYPKGASQA